MIKQCNVILNNELVTVVRFGETNVQLPAIGKDAKSIYVCYENGKYFVVDENKALFCDEETAAKPRKRASKKTTAKNDETVIE